MASSHAGSKRQVQSRRLGSESRRRRRSALNASQQQVAAALLLALFLFLVVGLEILYKR